MTGPGCAVMCNLIKPTSITTIATSITTITITTMEFSIQEQIMCLDFFLSKKRKEKKMVCTNRLSSTYRKFRMSFEFHIGLNM